MKQSLIVQGKGDSRIVGNGGGGILSDNSRLTVGKVVDLLHRENTVVSGQRRIVEKRCRHRLGDFLKTGISLAPHFRPPCLVERFNGSVFIPEPLVPKSLAGGAAALLHMAFQLVVQLPGRHAGKAAQFPGHRLHNLEGVQLEEGVVGTDVLPRPMLIGNPILVDKGRLRMAKGQPAGRRGRRGAKNSVNPVTLQKVNHISEKAQINFSGFGLHFMPGKLSDAHTVDPQGLHFLDILGNFPFRPQFGIIGCSVVKRLCHVDRPFPLFFCWC